MLCMLCLVLPMAVREAFDTQNTAPGFALRRTSSRLPPSLWPWRDLSGIQIVFDRQVRVAIKPMLEGMRNEGE